MEDNRKIIIDRIKKGDFIPLIARDLNMKINEVKRIAKEEGLKAKEHKPYVIELLKNEPDLSYIDIAKKFGITNDSVRKWAIESGYERKNKKDIVRELIKENPNITAVEVQEVIGTSMSIDNINVYAVEITGKRLPTGLYQKEQLIIDAITHDPKLTASDIADRYDVSMAWAYVVTKKHKLKTSPPDRHHGFSKKEIIIDVLTMDPYISVAEIANKYDVSTSWVYTVIKQNNLERRKRR